jgi:lipoprotein-anchoring transpeptidase ErfK/SrfK
LPRSGAWKNGLPGYPRPRYSGGSAHCRPMSPVGRIIRWAHAAFTYIPATRTRCIASTGTNQPEYIGQAVSSGCIRMTNEDAIDLYNRVKIGVIVVVLAPKQGDAPFNPMMASGLNAATAKPY